MRKPTDLVDYVPPVAISYWTFRMMVGAGTLMLLILIYLMVAVLRSQLSFKPFILHALVWAMALPYVANTAGWIFTEVARQPWAVFGVLRVESAVSTSVGAGAVLFSLILFCIVYGALMVADVYLLKKYATAGTTLAGHQE